MINHTIILTTPKIDIPASNIIDFTKELIITNLLNIDYFGGELDNQADYIDEKMQDKIDNTTYITFHFNYSEIDYDKLNEVETLQLIVDVLEQQNIGEVIVDDKDVECFIYQRP